MYFLSWTESDGPGQDLKAEVPVKAGNASNLAEMTTVLEVFFQIIFKIQ